MATTNRLGLYKPTDQESVDIVAAVSNNLQVIDEKVALESERVADFDGATGHKHTGAPGDAPKIGAGGLADGAATDTVIGNRTVDQALANPANTGTLTQILSWLTGKIKAILGTTNWTDGVPLSLQAAKNHVNATSGAHSAAAISYGGAPGLQATDVEAALDELDAEKAALGLANTFSQRQTFQGGITDGDSNQDVSYLKSFPVALDTRTWTATAWDANNSDLPTTIEVKDAATLVATISITYNSEGKPTQMVVTAGGKSVTYTQTWNNLTQFASRTKAVV